MQKRNKQIKNMKIQKIYIPFLVVINDQFMRYVNLCLQELWLVSYKSSDSITFFILVSFFFVPALMLSLSAYFSFHCINKKVTILNSSKKSPFGELNVKKKRKKKYSFSLKAAVAHTSEMLT